MKHLWSGAAAAILSLAATAAAQAPMTPSGAVNTPEPPSINFPGAAPSPPPAPPAEAAPRPAAEPVIPAPSPAASETAGKPVPEAPSTAGAAPAPGAAPEESATRPAAAAPAPERERKAAVERPKRPVRGAGEASRPASAREGLPGDNVADMLNARELSRLTGNAGPVPVVRPYGPPPRYAPPPPYGPPPGYAPPPPYPPVMMRPPY